MYFGKLVQVSDKESEKLNELQMKQVLQNRVVSMSMRSAKPKCDAKPYKKTRITHNPIRDAYRKALIEEWIKGRK